jgi:hypothetical protein
MAQIDQASRQLTFGPWYRAYISSFGSLFAIFLFSRERVVPVICHRGDVHLWHALTQRGYSIRIRALLWRGRRSSDEGVGANRQLNFQGEGLSDDLHVGGHI